MIDYAATRKAVARLQAPGLLRLKDSDAVAGHPGSKEGNSGQTDDPKPVTFPALTEAELFWGIAGRVTKRRAQRTSPPLPSTPQ